MNDMKPKPQNDRFVWKPEDITVKKGGKLAPDKKQEIKPQAKPKPVR